MRFCINRFVIHATLAALLVMSGLAGDARAGNGGEERIKKAIVKVFTVTSTPDYYSPWTMGAPRRASGSGCVIEGGRILTNAHVVSNATFIQVQPYGSSKRYNAKVQHVSHESDLALLVVEEGDFFKGIRPLKFGGLPEVLEEVLAYGFPLGGDSLSITKGIISRIEYQEYAHGGYFFLAGQIDAAINPGNSGGPVMQDGEVVGIVMQAYNSSQAENIGYMIPTPLIHHFLDDLSDGSYDGFPEVGFSIQDMESPALKRKYGMSDEQTGVLVNKVFWNSPASDHIKAGDVLLKIDGHPIADDGSVEFRPNERVVFGYYSDLHQLGEDIRLTMLRDGKEVEVRFAMTQRGEDVFLVPPMHYDVHPEY
ncbi:MAG: trypsin-like peptidase domain-containing protein, partial [Thermodesulfovibrionales bacterium]|nr:trypsin-like peptidase domain-containing protein [Thermodesulfovibrionales bacterium]